MKVFELFENEFENNPSTLYTRMFNVKKKFEEAGGKYK